jgi:hypothetical protein
MNPLDGLRRWLTGASMSGRGDLQRCSTLELPGVSDPQVEGMCLERYRLDQCIEYLESNRPRIPAFESLLRLYKIARRFPDLSNFRLGPNMFEQIPVDWIVLVRSSGSGSRRQSRLVAHGLACRAPWNGNPCDLPGGWQGVVRLSYENHLEQKQPDDTLVGLFIKVEEEFRDQGWAGHVVAAMKELGSRCGLSRLIIPLRLPTRYERRYSTMPFEEFASLRRETGDYRDHWLRLHVRLGAQIIGYCNTSHQHAMNVGDFHQQFEAERCETNGYVSARRNGEWYHAYVDLERDCVVISEGCVWVQHMLESRS